MTLEGPRVLRKTIPVIYGDTDAEAPPSTAITVVGDWEDLGNNTWAFRTYFDLSGYNMEDLTCFFQGVDIQEGTWVGTDMNQFNVVDLITTEYMTDDACIRAGAPGFDAGDAPGFSNSVYDLQQVVYGRRRVWLRTDAAQVGQHTPYYGASMYGTCAAASVDKLHVTRIISTTSLAPQEFFRVSPAAFVVALVVSEEAELPYLMRQKRSYELATGP
jgi:hypothetical protein